MSMNSGDDVRPGTRVPRPRAPRDFDEYYLGTAPWDIGRPQRAFTKLARAGLVSGTVLDVGCGTGEHALLAASIGLRATGIDSSPAAIDAARKKAAARRLDVTFLVADALELHRLGTMFDTVIDCGLFHNFTDDDRARFVESLRSVVPPGGLYHMLCFSDRHQGDLGPRRIAQAEIRTAFAQGWQVLSIEASAYERTISAGAAYAWLASMARQPAGIARSGQLQ